MVGDRTDTQVKIGKKTIRKKALSTLDDFKSLRPDGLYHKDLKEWADVISEPLNNIFQASGVQENCLRIGKELMWC